MHVEVERGTDVGVPQDGAYRLVVTLALDAAGGETMTEPVKLHRGDAQLIEQALEMVAIGTRLEWCCPVGQQVTIGMGFTLHLPQHLDEFLAQWYVAYGAGCLR